MSVELELVRKWHKTISGNLFFEASHQPEMKMHLSACTPMCQGWHNACSSHWTETSHVATENGTKTTLCHFCLYRRKMCHKWYKAVFFFWRKMVEMFCAKFG